MKKNSIKIIFALFMGVVIGGLFYLYNKQQVRVEYSGRVCELPDDYDPLTHFSSQVVLDGEEVMAGGVHLKVWRHGCASTVYSTIEVYRDGRRRELFANLSGYSIAQNKLWMDKGNIVKIYDFGKGIVYDYGQTCIRPRYVHDYRLDVFSYLFDTGVMYLCISSGKGLSETKISIYTDTSASAASDDSIYDPAFGRVVGSDRFIYILDSSYPYDSEGYYCKATFVDLVAKKIIGEAVLVDSKDLQDKDFVKKLGLGVGGSEDISSNICPDIKMSFGGDDVKKGSRFKYQIKGIDIMQGGEIR